VTTAPRILTISVTRAGGRIAQRLPYEHHHGDLAGTLTARWAEVDGLVVVAAVGAAVRLVAPLLTRKEADPAVVCVDDAGRYVVPLLGGHAKGANALAREIAGILGAEAVITTATDATGVPALDQLPGLRARGDVAGVTAALIAGDRPVLDRRHPWPLPDVLLDLLDAVVAPNEAERPPAHRTKIVVTDEVMPDERGTVVLSPPTLVAGIGTSTDATPADVEQLLDETLAECGLDRRSVAEVATIDRRRDHEALTALGLPITSFPAGALRTVDVPTPSRVVEEEVGTPSVAEAAALLAAGTGATLACTKRTSPRATLALARRSAPPGRVTLVGLGPGGAALRTPEATAALRRASAVVGFHAYLDQCREVLTTSQDVLGSPIGEEVERARVAVKRAEQGQEVAVVCSGDSGIYAMASIVVEEAGDHPGVEVEVVPGVTAALAAAARLGAPLGHDHLVLSLSDLLTAWELIRARAEAARDTDLVLALYNPRSRQRDWQLSAVRDLLLEARAGATPVGIVTDAGRPGEQVTLTTLAELDPELVGMTSCVIIGSSTTRIVNGRMVTPRGYRREPEAT
jgi:cobalt-precorrin 5A hydrolase/precorrin-3B C17-methyltransferase